MRWLRADSGIDPVSLTPISLPTGRPRLPRAPLPPPANTSSQQARQTRPPLVVTGLPGPSTHVLSSFSSDRVPVFPLPFDPSALPWFLTTCLYFRRRRKAGGQESVAAGKETGAPSYRAWLCGSAGTRWCHACCPGGCRPVSATMSAGRARHAASVRSGRCAVMWVKRHTGPHVSASASPRALSRCSARGLRWSAAAAA